MTRILLALVLLIAVSCSTPEKVSSRSFYNLDSLINVQVLLLSESGSRLQKKAGIGESFETVEIIPDSAGWSKELAVFRQLEVAGRPTNRDKYEMTEEEDTRSNLRVRSYVASETPVPYIRLYYLDGIRDLRRIEARYYESNLLYTSKRDLTLEFDNGDGTATLKRYSIAGFQKMIMADSVHFSVEAEVIY